jgi:transcriptional regulator with GAF, ATPase, and Fis domain
MPMVAPERLAEVFVDVADTLVDDFDLVDFLQRLVVHTSGLVDAHAAGLLLADNGRLQLMAASDETAEMLELFQVQTSEGPCHDCYQQGQAVINADLREAADRWPVFAPRAVAAGYRSVHAFPLRWQQQVLGALNLFGVNAGNMATDDARVVQALADVATIGLLQERAIRHGAVISEQLQVALDSRVVVEQAKGALAQIHGGSPLDGSVLLRAYCERHGLRLADVAWAVVHAPDTVPDLTLRGR